MRSSGVLLHPSSLPGLEPIGTIGKSARNFVDWLVAAKQSWWQVLPLGPTGYGSSPYMATSSLAGNPLLIDLADLVERRWLEEDWLERAPETEGSHIDFESATQFKRMALEAAFAGFVACSDEAERDALVAWRSENASWADGYALFAAITSKYPERCWNEWPASLAAREPAAVAEARESLGDIIDQNIFEQWVFALQWGALRKYANTRGVRIIGDIPIFVSFHSADVWMNPQYFILDSAGAPTVVAGVPPDYFSETGQRWGNPLYRWDALQADGYRWWIDRFAATYKLVDCVRIDHFRGFESYWEVPASEPTAINGRWIKGPGRELFDAVRGALGDVPIIAEDLGIITPEVDGLRRALELPGMRVLHFGFGGDNANTHLPHNYDEPSVVYTGTHDNDTSVGWFAACDDNTRHHVRTYLGTDGNDIAWTLIAAAWKSVARLAVTTVQDLLEHDTTSRMNTPGTAEGNWSWRMTEPMRPDIATRLARLTEESGRANS
jgi:4-alpha-glucanotransferase